MQRWLPRVVTVCLLAFGMQGCGGSGTGGFSNDGGTDGSAPPEGGGARDATDSHDALRLGDVGNGPDATEGYACSRDLQSVLNEAGQVVTMCPPDQGCAGGKCVPACEAAAAAKGAMGCDFVLATPSFYPYDTPPCFAVYVANNWGKAVTIAVSRNGSTYDPTTFGLVPVSGEPESSWGAIPATGVPEGNVGILFLEQDPTTMNLGTPLTCPIPPAVSQTDGTAIYTGTAAATGLGQAWHIVTDVPVTAYDILPYGGAKSYLPAAELMIPTTAWTTNYYGIVPYGGDGLSQAQWGQLVASQDGTVVKVVPKVALPGGTGVAAAPADAVTTYTLDAGQYIQWQDSGEMSSTIISSNLPIGFVGGLGLECYESTTSPGGGGCDSAHQQIPPISALGNDYVAPPFATRMASLAPESIPYRIVGVVDGTVLTYDPSGIAPAPTDYYGAAPATLSAGQVADFETTLAFRVSSQDPAHPFYVGQIMPGCEVTGGSRPGCGDPGPLGCCLGDEEFVNILPPAQFLQKYVFFTDLTYATTNLVFTRVKTASGFEDVKLDCAGTLTGWVPVGTEGLYEITNIDLVRAALPNGSCNNGPHTASSSGPFGLMVWGEDSFSSYAYPAGGNVTSINTVVVPPTPPK
jgi:hypothetical protein